MQTLTNHHQSLLTRLIQFHLRRQWLIQRRAWDMFSCLNLFRWYCPPPAKLHRHKAPSLSKHANAKLHKEEAGICFAKDGKPCETKARTRMVTLGNQENTDQIYRRFASYSLCFLDHIWYSLEHTGNAWTYGVSLEHTRITPRTYQEATNDYTGIGLRVVPGYTRILAQGIVIGYAKTPLDCPQMPSRKKTIDNFLGNEHALGSLSQDIRNIQRISAR